MPAFTYVAVDGQGRTRRGVVDAEAARVFDVNPGNAHAARFMTITCDVRPEWRERIPAVVHVDGSARPQTIRPDGLMSLQLVGEVATKIRAYRNAARTIGDLTESCTSLMAQEDGLTAIEGIGKELAA